MAGRSTCKLHSLYSKKIIGKLELQKPLASSLTDTAKGAKQRRRANKMMETVKAMHGHDVVLNEETAKKLHGLETGKSNGLGKWLRKLQFDFQAKEKQMPL